MKTFSAGALQNSRAPERRSDPRLIIENVPVGEKGGSDACELLRWVAHQAPAPMVPTVAMPAPMDSVLSIDRRRTLEGSSES